MDSSDVLGVPLALLLTIEEAGRVLRIGRSLAYQLAQEYEGSGGLSGLPVIRLGGCLRVPRWALLELVLTGRVVRLCDVEVPAEATGDDMFAIRAPWAGMPAFGLPRERGSVVNDVFVVTGAARRRWGKAMLGVSVMVLAVTTQVGQATAQTTPPPPTLTKTVIVGGDSVGVSGEGCVAGTQVQVQLDSVTLVTATSTATGTYSALLVVPKTVTPGAHPVTVVCTGPNGIVTANATITVTATATTGYSPRAPIVVAITLLMLGGVCLVVAIRRRSRLRMAR